jgi:putative SOS response-associated peptidase YedK
VKHNLQPRYNICPTTTIDAVLTVDGKKVLAPMRWGLIPAWWSKPLKEMKLATFNARAESPARSARGCSGASHRAGASHAGPDAAQH